jgi:hypothetical protein
MEFHYHLSIIPVLIAITTEIAQAVYRQLKHLGSVTGRARDFSVLQMRKIGCGCSQLLRSAN